MEFDELFYRRIEILKDDIINYINEVYLQGIEHGKIEKIIAFLDKWDKDRKMLDNIAFSLAIEGNLNIKEIEEKRLNKEISKILFEKYISDLINKTDFKKLNIAFYEKINDLKLKVMIKDYLSENIREFFNNETETLNNYNIYVACKNKNINIMDIRKDNYLEVVRS